MSQQAAAAASGTTDGSSAPSPALELRDITAGYGRAIVLRNVNVELGTGVIDAVLGSNGAGKTTMLRTAAGLLRPSGGSVYLNGVDVTRDAPSSRARAGLCLIPEGRGVFPNLTVKENLMLQAPKRQQQGVLDRAIEAFPVLRDRRHQIAGSMSGGEQQMLAVARCYLSSPSVVLLDEVSSGLAPRIVDQIFDTLMQLVTDGISILLVEQYVNRALEMASTVHLLNRGEIMFAGPASDLDERTVLRGYLGVDMQADERAGAADATADAAVPMSEEGETDN